MRTEREVTCKIVYDGDRCSRECGFLNDDLECTRHSMRLGIRQNDGAAFRCEQCKVEARIDDIALGSVPTLTPEQVAALDKEIQEATFRLRKHVWEEIDKAYKEWEARFKR